MLSGVLQELAVEVDMSRVVGDLLSSTLEYDDNLVLVLGVLIRQSGLLETALETDFLEESADELAVGVWVARVSVKGRCGPSCRTTVGSLPRDES
jgi:hypothetical protein